MELNIRKIHPKTLDRLEEVRFYLIIKQLENQKIDSMYKQILIETICKSYGISITDINQAIIYTKANRPNYLELQLLNSIYSVNIRTLRSLGKVSHSKMIEALKKYIAEDYEQPLEPCIEKEITVAVKQFNKAYTNLFKNSTYLTKGIL